MTNSSKTHIPSLAPSKEEQSVLEGFNGKVSRLEAGGFYSKFVTTEPNINYRFNEVESFNFGEMTVSEDGMPSIQFEISGYVHAWVDDFDQDAIDAFVLTYRMLTQNNDRYGLQNLAKIYSSPWMHHALKAAFDEARTVIQNNLKSSTTVDFGDGPVPFDRLMDVIIYGGLAHSNVAKESQFNDWTSNPTMGASMWIEFIALMRSHMQCFLRIRDINAASLHWHFGCEAPEHLR